MSPRAPKRKVSIHIHPFQSTKFDSICPVSSKGKAASAMLCRSRNWSFGHGSMQASHVWRITIVLFPYIENRPSELCSSSRSDPIVDIQSYYQSIDNKEKGVLLPYDSVLRDFIETKLDMFYILGPRGLGISLYLIHIYTTQIKGTLQEVFCALGVFGSLVTYYVLAQPACCSLVQYVVENPIAVWSVGPLFAVLTWMVFKEVLCYEKLEAGILTFIIQLVLLGHLTGLMDNGVKVTLLSIWMTLFLVFVGRKFT